MPRNLQKRPLVEIDYWSYMAYSHEMPGNGQTAIQEAGRRERRRAETQQRILDAALQLFTTHGYLETTVEEITEAADVGKGTFFNYFPTKDALLAAIFEAVGRQFAQLRATIP
jgi:AcrR family transcriptional regulator